MAFLVFSASAVAMVVTMFGIGFLYPIWGHLVAPFSATRLNILLLLGVFLTVVLGTAAGLIGDNRNRRKEEGSQHGPAAVLAWAVFVGLAVSLLTNLTLHAMVMLRATLGCDTVTTLINISPSPPLKA